MPVLFLKAIGAASGAGTRAEERRGNLLAGPGVARRHPGVAPPVGCPCTSEAAVRAERADRRARYPGLLFLPVVRIITATVLP